MQWINDLKAALTKRAEMRSPQGYAGLPASPPTLTGGESPLTEGAAKVDWLSLTFLPSPDECIDLNLHTVVNKFMGGVIGESDRPMFGYESAVRFYCVVDGSPVYVCRLDFGGEKHKGRARFDITGTGCSRITNWPGFQAFLASLEALKITRVDLAVDCLNGEFSVEDCIDWYQCGLFNMGGRNPRHNLIGDYLNPLYGRTFEVGRRENGKMLRCYEKGRQLGDSSSLWTRFEVELRNNDREIPLSIITKCNDYFVGTYKALEQIILAAAERIKTHQKDGEISIDQLVIYTKQQYGRLINVLSGVLSSEEIINLIVKEGVPKRLEKSTLGGFNLGRSFSHSGV